MSKNQGKLTIKQARAIRFLPQSGFNKAAALRKAGYSESVARHPDKVFGSPVVEEYLRKEGLLETTEFEPLKIRDGGKAEGGAYRVEKTEDGLELVKIQASPRQINEMVDIPSRDLLEVAKYSNPNDPFAAGDASSQFPSMSSFSSM